MTSDDAKDEYGSCHISTDNLIDMTNICDKRQKKEAKIMLGRNYELNP